MAAASPAKRVLVLWDMTCLSRDVAPAICGGHERYLVCHT